MNEDTESNKSVVRNKKGEIKKGREQGEIKNKKK